MIKQEIHRTKGLLSTPNNDRFALLTTELSGTIEDGQLLAKNLWMSLHPGMRPRMNEVRSYVSPFRLNAPLQADAIGEAVVSKNAKFPAGTVLPHG